MIALAAERIAGLDRLLAELVAQLIHRRFGRGTPARLLVDQIRRIGAGGIAEIGDADADQAELRAISLLLEKFEAGAENPVGKLGRVFELAVAGARS